MPEICADIRRAACFDYRTVRHISAPEVEYMVARLNVLCDEPSKFLGHASQHQPIGVVNPGLQSTHAFVFIH